MLEIMVWIVIFLVKLIYFIQKISKNIIFNFIMITNTAIIKNGLYNFELLESIV